MVAARTLRGEDGCFHFSVLKRMSQSPAHALYAATTRRRATRRMNVGTLVDRLTFGGDVAICPLDQRSGTKWELFTLLAGGGVPLIGPGDSRATKAWKAFQEEHPAKRAFLQREVDDAAELVAKLPSGRRYTADDFCMWSELAEAQPIADALQADPIAREYLAGRHQVPLEWEMQGVRCATSGIDCVGDRWLSDLKVTTSTHPDRFAWQARNRMLWHAQLAWYGWGAVANGIPVDKGLFLVGVEATAPHPVTVLRLSERVIEEGRRACHLWLEQARACEETGEFPGYVQSVVELDVEAELELVGLDEEEAST